MMTKQMIQSGWLILLLVGCTLAAATPTSTPPTATAPPPVRAATDAQWENIAPGLEQRVYIPGENELAQMIAVRIDPALYRFQVHYRPGEPLSLRQWQDELPAAEIIVNANFFDPQHNILGLLISDGVRHGSTYTRRGGTFGILDGVPRITSNIQQPYQGEPYEQAVQAFPMLVYQGEQAFFNERGARGSRRTVIGQDDRGNIILMATPGIGLSLPDLSAYLAGTDIGFVNAFNLDGGGSTMMFVDASDTQVFSFDAVPAVLAVYAVVE